jgi:hypothetical protein
MARGVTPPRAPTATLGAPTTAAPVPRPRYPPPKIKNLDVERCPYVSTPRSNRRRPPLEPVAVTTIPVPTFSDQIPAPAPDDDPAETLTTSVPLGEASGSVFGTPSVSDPAPATRTATSSGGTTPVSRAATERNAAKVVVAVVAIVCGAASLALGRLGRRLREPTADQVADFAEPVAAILARHIPAEKLNADVADLAKASVPVSEWMRGGPIAPPAAGPVRHIGMEHAAPVDPVDPVDGGGGAYPPPPIVEDQIAEDAWHLATRDPNAHVTFQN